MDTFGNIVKDKYSHLVYPQHNAQNTKSVQILTQLVVEIARE